MLWLIIGICLAEMPIDRWPAHLRTSF
jgi:hypothetical protein